jgi:mono/diheme cytochrome c family protein
MTVLRQRYALAVLLLAGPAAAQGLPGDPTRGEAIAEQWCSECHEIAPDMREPLLSDAPPFQVVADHPATTEMALHAFLQTQHATMPNLQPTPEETADLIAYILSLKGHKPGT